MNIKLKQTTLALGFVLISSILSAQNSYWKVKNAADNVFLLKISISEDKFKASTRKKCIKNAIGGKNYMLGKLFGKVKQDEIVKMAGNCSKSGDTTILEGNYSSIYSNQKMQIKLFGDSLIGYTYRVDTLKHPMQGSKLPSNEPLNNYTELITKAFQLTEKYIYNPDLMEHKKWKKFKKRIFKVEDKITDNWDLTTSYGYAAFTTLPFTHYGITRKSNEKGEEHYEYPQLKEISEQTALLTIKSFSGPRYLMDSVIDKLKKKNYQNLIIDLRNNPGGSVEMAMPLASYLAKDDLYGGVFLTRKWFENHKELPKNEDYNDFPHFTEASFDLIIDGIHGQEALCLKVVSEDQHFKGKVYILTDNITASTCEPLVYGLKYCKMATIIGEKTAGAMLNGEIFPLNNELQLWIPTAEYYTVDGKKLDQIGVEPDIKVESEEALYKTLELIKQE